MKPRFAITLLLLLLAGPLAFAPAPLPRREREEQRTDAITLKTFQGSWRIRSLNVALAAGRQAPEGYTATHVRIVQDRWTFMTHTTEGSTLFISIDHKKTPAQLDFYDHAEKRAVYGVAIIRRHLGRLEVAYSWGNERHRLGTFDPVAQGFWIITLERDG